MLCAKLCPVSDRSLEPSPDFAHPPVVEVGLAVQFAESLGFGADDVTELSSAWAEGLPEVSLRPVLPRWARIGMPLRILTMQLS